MHRILSRKLDENGFGLIELLVVIIIIGILAAVAIPIFVNQQKAANAAVQKQDLRHIEQAITAAKIQSGNISLFAITGVSYSAGECPGSSDFANLPRTHTCWVTYQTVLDKISTASGMNIRNMVDPYGRPYLINPNELELGPTDCRNDNIGYWTDVYTGTIPGVAKSLPLSTTKCAS